MSTTVFVEGGGQSKDLRTRCRQGFHEFLDSAMPAGRMPRFVACGSRKDAFDRFCTAISHDPCGAYMLLVDSEDVCQPDVTRWQHVKQRSGDGWDVPSGATDDHLHFMAVCMESWLIADPSSLARFYAKGFEAGQLPETVDLETVEKATVFDSLQRATRATVKGEYSKGKVSFAALGSLDVTTVSSRMPHCRRFVDHLSASH